MKRKPSYKKVQSFNEILSEFFYLPRLVVIDVGCGIGDLVRFLASQGAIVTGVDLPDLIQKAKKIQRVADEHYLTGNGQDLPFKNNYADLIIYMASFHHIPVNEMEFALDKCHNILKHEGYAVFIEPVAQKDTYYELTRLANDEKEIQEKAYDYILKAGESKFERIVEAFYFAERAYQDFLNLINIYVSDENRRVEIILQAKEIVLAKNKNLESAKFRSLVRLNILKKI